MSDEATVASRPIVIDLGKIKKKGIKRLKRGQGRLVGEVSDAVSEVAAHLGDSGAGKELVPVVIVYRQKRKKRKKRNTGLATLLLG